MSIFCKTSKWFPWDLIVWWFGNFALVGSMVLWFGGSSCVLTVLFLVACIDLYGLDEN